MSCGSITRGSQADCDNLPPGGTNARLILINHDEVTGFTEDQDLNITDITLSGGSSAYEFLGFRNDVKKSEDVIKPEVGIPKFKHTVGFVVYENTQIQKNNVENLARGRFVAIVENRGKDANSFEVVGRAVGLEIVAGPIRNAHENGGFFVINLSTPDEQGELEPQLPQTLLAGGSSGTPYEGNLAFIESLLPAS